MAVSLIVDNLSKVGEALKKPFNWTPVIVVGIAIALAISIWQIHSWGRQFHYYDNAPDTVATATTTGSSYCAVPSAGQVGQTEEPVSPSNITQVPNPGSLTVTCNGLVWKWKKGIGFLPYPKASEQWCRFINGIGQVEYHVDGRDCASSRLKFATKPPPSQGMQVSWYDPPTKLWFQYGGSNVLLGSTNCGSGSWHSINIDSLPGQHGAFFDQGATNCNSQSVSYHRVMAAYKRFIRAPAGFAIVATASQCETTFNSVACNTAINS